MLIRDIRDALVIREQDIFLLTDTSGNVPPDNPSGFGLYHLDTRHLSVYDFSFADARPVVLLSTAELGFSEEQMLTNSAMPCVQGRILPRGSLEVQRQRVVEDVLEETLRVTNYNIFPIEIDVVYTLDADFADMFEVRGSKRAKRGRDPAAPHGRRHNGLRLRWPGRPQKGDEGQLLRAPLLHRRRASDLPPLPGPSRERNHPLTGGR